MLWLAVKIRHGTHIGGGSWLSAFALFAYAAGFSFASMSLPAATGALLLFGAVQVTRIGYGIGSGERLLTRQLVGLMFALGGLVGLLLPGLSAPPLHSFILMSSAGARLRLIVVVTVARQLEKPTLARELYENAFTSPVF